MQTARRQAPYRVGRAIGFFAASACRTIAMFVSIGESFIAVLGDHGGSVPTSSLSRFSPVSQRRMWSCGSAHIRGSLQLVALVVGEVLEHLVDRKRRQLHGGGDRLAVVAA